MLDFNFLHNFFLRKNYRLSAYVCVLLHVISGTVLTAITAALRLLDKENFSCAVATTFTTHKIHVEKTCLEIYNDIYNFPVRLFGFVLLSFIPVAGVSFIYSVVVGSRVDKVGKYLTDRPLLNDSNKPGTRTLYVFYSYFFHLVGRSTFGMLLTSLQFTVLYPNGFDSEFICVYTALSQDPNITTAENARAPLSRVKCSNTAAHEKQTCSYAVLGYNVIFALVTLFEVIYMVSNLTKRERFPFFKPESWSCDFVFIAKYFLDEKHISEEIRLPGVDISTENYAQMYKQKILEDFLKPHINCGLNCFKSLNDMFIAPVIRTRQLHKVNDFFMKVPENSTGLKELNDLFNKDSKGNLPRTILALGGPGVGKTVLTGKIMQDWAINSKNEGFYHEKIAFFNNIGLFQIERLQNVTLKEFLQYETELSEDEFKSLYKVIKDNPQNAIFIFDGLDQFDESLQEFQNIQNQSNKFCDEPNCCMPAMFHFLRILSGKVFSGATVLVTSRPTVVLSKLFFERTVEVVGFTDEKIKNYVENFFADDELKLKTWNRIKSLELENLCRIPGISCTVCKTLLANCPLASDQGNHTNTLSTTKTELYRAVLLYFQSDHDRNKDQKHKKKLQQLSWHSMEEYQWIFECDSEYVTEEMKKSGLLLHDTDKDQVYFIDPTIQDFLAAQHIEKTKEPKSIEKIISANIEKEEWQLVLQFLAGLLKNRNSEGYRNCILAFGERLGYRIQGDDRVYVPNARQVRLMKCIRETENEEMAEKIAMTSALKDVTCVQTYDGLAISPIDWEAIVFVCKYLNNLRKLTLLNIANFDCIYEISKLFHHKCIESLKLSCKDIPVEKGLKHLLDTITASQCSIGIDNHEHLKLAHLDLSGNQINIDCISTLTDFLENGHGVFLKELNLENNEITCSGISKFYDVLVNEKCRLTDLSLSGNNISDNTGDEGVEMLFYALKAKQCSLTKLNLSYCSLTNKCMNSLGEALGHENCQLTNLNLKHNDIGDEGVYMLYCALEKGKHIKLTVLNLQSCSLTDGCIPFLYEILRDKSSEHPPLCLDPPDFPSQVVKFVNTFTSEGSKLLMSAQSSVHCKFEV